MTEWLTETLPSCDELIAGPDEAVAAFCAEHRISTAYLPLDGTRRRFVARHQGPLPESEEEFLRAYWEASLADVTTLFWRHFELGIRTVIVLIVDDVVLARGEVYSSVLWQTITDTALRLVGRDPLYARFMRRFAPRIAFSSTNDAFEAYRTDDSSSLSIVEQATAANEGRRIVIHTGTAPADDQVFVARAALELAERGVTVNWSTLVERLYGLRLEPIDYSVCHGPPRELVMPPLLCNHSPRFFTMNSNLGLEREQIITAIYHTALAKQSSFARYHDYSYLGLTDEQRSELRREESAQAAHLYGTDLYEQELAFMRGLVRS